MRINKTVFTKNILLLILFTVSSATLSGQTISYTESNSIIANPERGLQKYSKTSKDYATTPGANNLSVSMLNTWKNSNDKVTVVYRYFMLESFMNSDINSTYLANIQKDFDNVRSAGLKIIVRFAYTNSIGTDAQQPVKSQILTHITQLSPILNKNKDVIFSFQAGFVGTWGEWYYTNSDEFGTEGTISTNQWANRKEILDSMLAAAPVEIPIQVRYPGIKTRLYGKTKLTEETAYQNTANSRIGFFNDAFLNNYGDMGTYSVSSKCKNPVGTTDYIYLSNETKYLPMTGETNGINECDAGFRTTGDNAVYEMGLTNWTTLNRDYYTPFWEQLTQEQYREILKKLGYRFVLNSSSIVSNGSDFDLTLNISNVGFARLFKERNVYLVLKNVASNDTIVRLINTDIRTWETSVTISQNFGFDLSGTFQLYLWIPDIEPLLANNPDYSIQFANSGTWDSNSGMNNLLQTVDLYSLNLEDKFLENQLSVYGNPSSDFITVQFGNSEKEEVQIFNEKGQLVIETTTFNNEKIDISELLNGLYFIRLNNNKLLTQKFIKQ